MSGTDLQKRIDAHFELLARETVRLKLASDEARAEHFQRQREFLFNSLSGAGLSQKQTALELEAFDAALAKLEAFAGAVSSPPAPQPAERAPTDFDAQGSSELQNSNAEEPRPTPVDQGQANTMNGGAAGWLKQPATPIAAASIGAILLLSGLFVFFFHGSEKEDPNKLAHSHVEQTKTHLLKKDYDAAIREYGAAIRLDPDPAYLYSNRGNIYLTQKKYDKAIEDFGRGIKRDPKSVYLHTYRGQAHAARREADKAISDYGEAIRLGGRDADLFVRRGEADMQEANLQLRRKPAVAQYYYRKALGDLDYALRVDPSSRSAVRRRQEALKGEKQAKAGAARQMFEAVKAGLKGEKQQAGVLSQSPSSSKGDPAEKKAPERRESTSQNGSRNSGTANSCFRVSHSSIPQISLQKMLRSDAERAKAVRSAIMKSGAADPLEFVWGAIPVERRSQSADGGWNEYFHVVERIDFRKPTRCVEGDFLYASIDALANGSVARENKRARNGPNVRLVRNWKELIIRYRDE